MLEHLSAQAILLNPPSAIFVFEASNELVSNHCRNHSGLWLTSQDAAIGVDGSRLNFDVGAITLLLEHPVVVGADRMAIQIQGPRSSVFALQGRLHGDRKRWVKYRLN